MKDNNILWVDLIRIVASFSVVMLHCAAPLLYKYNSIPAVDWWAGNIYDSAVRASVPLFFLISGYLLLGKQEPLLAFVQKRINKILVPFIVWSVFYVFWAYYLDHSGSISLDRFYSLIISPSYYHLWFFYAIIGLYLFIPILRILVQYAPQEILCYFVILWFFAVSAIPFFETTTRAASAIDLNMISGYVGYLVIGYFLGNAQLNTRHFILAVLSGVVCLVITIAGTFYLTLRNNGELNGYLYGYLSPNVIVLAVSSFIILKYSSEKIITSTSQKIIVTRLSSASFGIYLIHPVILFIINVGWLGFALSAFTGDALYSVPLTAILTFGLSFLAVFFLQKIPLVRALIP